MSTGRCHHGRQGRSLSSRNEFTFDPADVGPRCADAISHPRKPALSRQDPDLATLLAGPWPDLDQAVPGPDRPAHRDLRACGLNPAGQLGPRELSGGTPVEGVGDPGRSRCGGEHALQHHGGVEVPPTDLVGDGRFQLDRSATDGTEHRRADRCGVHHRHRRPIDSPVGDHQRTSSHVTEHRFGAQQKGSDRRGPTLAWWLAVLC